MTTKTIVNAYTIQLATKHTPVPGTRNDNHVGLEIIQGTIDELAEAFENHIHGKCRLTDSLGGSSMNRFARVLREVASALQAAKEN